MERSFSFKLVCTVLAALPSFGYASADISEGSLIKPFKFQSSKNNQRVEEMIVAALSQIKEGNLSKALQTVENILEIKPNYKLALMIRGDLLLAKISPYRNIDPNSDNEKIVRNIEDLRREAQVRLSRYEVPPPTDKVPSTLVQISDNIKYVIVVQADKSRIFVFENDRGTPRYFQDFYVTLGKNGIGKEVEGDNRTPLGVYHVQTYIPGSKLPDLYGGGAYPINYPNQMDKKLGRTGYGIWIHGSPSDTYARAPLASNGCVGLTNDDLISLDETISTGITPVLISSSIDWVSYDDLSLKRNEIMDSIEGWRQDWESGDVGAYVSNYDSGFWSTKQRNLDAWKKHKANVIKKSGKISVELSSISIFEDPHSPDKMMVVNYTQNYTSNLVKEINQKTQYWVKRDGRWKILYEGDREL